MKKNYEQPKLTCVRLAATDILMTSGGTDEPSVVSGGLNTNFTGAQTELKWTEVWD